MNREKTFTCPLCLSNSNFFRYNIGDTAFRKCNDCKLTWQVNPKYPQKKYIEEYRTELSWKRKLFFKTSISLHDKHKFEIFEEMDKDINSLLDVGSAVGKFAYKLQRKGWDVECIEPNIQYADISIKNFKLKVHKCFLEDFKFERNYGLITFWGVFEHIYDAFKKLNRVIDHIHVGGYLVIGVPTDHIISMVEEHFYFFNKETFEKLAEVYHLELIKVFPKSYNNFGLYRKRS